MKKLFRFADIILLICATLAMLMQIWIFLDGPDDFGLYDSSHPGWIISWILSAVVLVFTWIVTRRVGNHSGYAANFPASLPAALGSLVGAVALAMLGIQRLADGDLWLDTLCGVLGLISAAGLLLAAFCRFKGAQPPFLAYMIPCFFLALYVFYLGRVHGGEPEPVRYLFRFLATLSLIPACYQLWGFCVGLGQRSHSLFWSLLAGYLCILSAPVGENGLMYLLLGIWMLTNLCVLKYLPRRSRPVSIPELALETEETAAPCTPEIPCTMEEDFCPTPEIAVEDSINPADPQEEPLDVDSIISDILREIDSNIT